MRVTLLLLAALAWAVAAQTTSKGLFDFLTPKPATAKPTTARPSTSQPTVRPTLPPTKQPSKAPSTAPTWQPTVQPTARQSSSQPTVRPTLPPTKQPSKAPSTAPTKQPTVAPTSATNAPTLPQTNAPTESTPTGTPTTSFPITSTPTTSFPTTSSPTTSSPNAGVSVSGGSVSGGEGKNAGGSAGAAPSTLSSSLAGSFLGALCGLALIATTVYGVRSYSAANKVDPDGVVVKPWDGGAPSGSPGSTLPRVGQVNQFSTGVLPTWRQSKGSENASRIEARYSAFFVNNPMYTVSSPIVKRFSMLRNSHNGSVDLAQQPSVALNV